MTENGTVSRPEPITRVNELLMERYSGAMPTIRQLDSAASSARFPVHRINGRRYVDLATLPLIAAIYGLTPKVTSSARRKGTDAPVSAAA